MPHQDLSSENTPYGFGLQLREAIEWLVLPKAFAGIQFRKDCSWTPWALTAAALLWAWADEPTLGGRFDSVRQIIQNVFGLQQELAGSYQAFLKMLVRWTATLKGRFLEALQRRMKRCRGCGHVAGCALLNTFYRHRLTRAPRLVLNAKIHDIVILYAHLSGPDTRSGLNPKM